MPKSKIKRYLKNVDVQFISLVDSAANRREFVYKSAGRYTPDFDRQINIRKLDEERQLVYGIVYAPDEADTYGDAMTAEELEKSAHNFLEKARTQNVDKQHDFKADDGVIVESYILGKNDSKFPDEKEGAWAVVIKVTDEETWDAVKKGDLKGISLAGKAQAEDVEDDSLEKFDSVLSKWAKKFEAMFKGTSETLAPAQGASLKKDFDARIKQKEMRQSIWALEEEFSSIFYDDDIDDKKAAIETAVKQFQEYISKLELGGNTTKSTNTMSTEKEKEKTEKSAEQTEADETEKTEKNEEAQVSEQLSALTESVTKLTEKVEELEKAAPGRQSTEGADNDDEGVKKSNPKAPLPILGS